MIDYDAMSNAETYVPPHMRDGYKRFFEHGISPGSFGQAIINGDKEGAKARADWVNEHHIDSQINWVKQALKQKGN